jgi:hypothetical protein
MPIKPENKDKYPANWNEIRERIKQRAEDRCEKCGVYNHAVGYRDKDGFFHRTDGNMYHFHAGYGNLPYSEARELAEFLNDEEEDGYKWIVIVCTVAHLDHNPENNADNNLAFLCQKCHNNYDRKHRNQTIRNNKLNGQLEIKL